MMTQTEPETHNAAAVAYETCVCAISSWRQWGLFRAVAVLLSHTQRAPLVHWLFRVPTMAMLIGS